MKADDLTSYDIVPYASYPYAKTHPDHLATLARLFGIDSPDPESCRVLELGCAAGGNLIPLVATLRNVQAVGVDLSARQIEEGQLLIKRLGTDQIRLECRSILDVDADFGTFDYIICHGVYSWVPQEVQDKILSICRTNLAQTGIAYVSYNTLPGWHLRGAVREMMKFHAGRFDDPETRVEQSRALLNFLISATKNDDSAYARILGEELAILHDRADAYLFHEHLEEVNEPIYFHEFVARADAAGLRFLCEAQLSDMVAGNFRPDIEETLSEIAPDLLHVEQYIDFLRNRMFRRSLLCHDEITPNRKLRSVDLAPLCVSAPVRPSAVAPDATLTSQQSVSFEHTNGSTITVHLPVHKIALVVLQGLWPTAMQFEKLLDAVCERLSMSKEEDRNDARQQLRDLVLECYASDLCRLTLHEGRFVDSVSERPATTQLVRLQAQQGFEATNLRHESVHLGNVERHLVCLLDGEHDRDAIREELVRLVVAGEIRFEGDDPGQLTQEAAEKSVDEKLDDMLEVLARNAMLVS